MKKLVVYGSAYVDIVKIIAAINRKSFEWDLIGFLEDDASLLGKEIMGIPVLGGAEKIPELIKQEDIWFFNNNYDWFENFLKRQEKLDKHNCKIPNIIHPDVDISFVEMGKGCIIAQGVLIGANVKLGNYVCMRIGSTLSHDCIVDDYAFLAPNSTVGSEVHLGKRAFISTGASIKPNLKIGEKAFLGAGSVAVKNVPANTTVVGIPAKPIKYPFSKIIKKKCKNVFKKITGFYSLLKTPNSKTA